MFLSCAMIRAMTKLKEKIEELHQILRITDKEERIEEIREEMNQPDFWLDDKKSAILSKELKNLEDEVTDFNDLYQMSQIATEEELESFKDEINKYSIYALFSGKYDESGAILSFYAGAGGDDAQDWNEMLLKMYIRWAENNGYKTEILDQSLGGETGIKSAVLEIDGSYAFGKLKGESGVHRLVRQSPFNAKALRQTSFALVQVMPMVEEETEVIIDSKDLKIDTYRASGHGGQSVNTTDSAVRITHLPTGITSTCQNERSQLQNKETAMKILRARLAQLLLEQHKEKVEEIRGDYSSPEWGNQIRSYVLHPYKQVKDHRTELEIKDPEAVLSGEIDPFIQAELTMMAKENKIE